MITRNNRLPLLLAAVAIILSIPLIAMQFTSEVNWNLLDFGVAGLLLGGTAVVVELILRKFTSMKQRMIFCGLTLFVLALVWAELAVGIFGSPIAGS
jgi:uncharacterized membrane protein